MDLTYLESEDTFKNTDNVPGTVTKEEDANNDELQNCHLDFLLFFLCFQLQFRASVCRSYSHLDGLKPKSRLQ